MFEIDPSKPIVWSRFARLTAVALALATALLLALSAEAGAARSAGSGAEGPVPPVPALPDPEGIPVPVPDVPTPPVVAEGTPEAAPAGSGTEGVPLPVPTGSGTEAAPEPSPEGTPVVPSGGAPEVVPPPEVPGPVPIVPPVETAPETGPPAGTEGGPLETVPGGKGKEDSQETVPAPGREGTSENLSSAGVGSSQDGGSSGHGGGEVLAPAPSLLAGPIAEASAVAGQRSAHPTTTSGAAGAGAPAGMALLRRPGDLTCELSALVGRMPSSCMGGPGGPQPLSTSPMTLIASADSLASGTTTGAPPDGGRGSSAVVRLPVSPAPGPAPSGVSGGAATGTSGLALSGFLTLAGLLLMAAPRAMRRLRLSCQPWLTACFVLIPERPG